MSPSSAHLCCPFPFLLHWVGYRSMSASIDGMSASIDGVSALHVCIAGALEKARKSMIHQQPGGLASHLRGSAAGASPALPPTALAGPPQAPSASHHSSMGASKHAQHAQAPSRPGTDPAAVAGDVSKGGHTGGSVTSSRPGATGGSLPEASGMSWNPVRLSSPFEKAAEPPTGVHLFTSHAVVEQCL